MKLNIMILPIIILFAVLGLFVLQPGVSHAAACRIVYKTIIYKATEQLMQSDWWQPIKKRTIGGIFLRCDL